MSTTRQTRSQTVAAQLAAQANLEIATIGDAAVASFEASTVDTERGDELDCAGCDRPNNAEMYMVKCERCECYYHFTCAGVTTATVNDKPYVCATCDIPKKTPSVRSAASATSSRLRAAQISLELQRMEEEKKLEDEIASFTLQQLERNKDYIAKKYELMSQQDENEDKMSECSRTNRTSADRLKNWIATQDKTGNNGLDIGNPMNSNVDSTNQSSVTPVGQLSAKVTSTPLVKSKSTSDDPQPLPKPTIDEDSQLSVLDFIRRSLDEQRRQLEENPASDVPPLIPPVNLQPILNIWDAPFTNLNKQGAFGKLVVPKSAYEMWRDKTKQNAQDKIHQEQEAARAKREQALADKVKKLEQQRREEQELQRQREKQLKLQLQRKEEEKAELIKQSKQVSSQQEEKFRKLERDLAEKLAALQAQQQKRIENKPEPSDDWYISELRKLQQMRLENSNRTGLSHGTPSPAPSVLSIGSSCVESPVGGRSSLISSSLPPDPPTPLPNGSNSVYDHHQLGPTSRQLAARQVVCKELPSFNGDHAEWPLFISSYHHSTETCGYTDSENLLRLQRSLRGNAREAVSSLLLHPSTVPQVLSSLKLLYGRPEQIVHNMIAKVRATPAPRGDRLDTLVTFGLVVQNLCGHLRAVGMEKHLSNPSLLYELVDKLPANVKFNWALYQQQLPEVDLNVFGEYMAKIASATSGVTFFAAAPKAPREDRSRLKEKAFVNAHTTTEQGQGSGSEFSEKFKQNSGADNNKLDPGRPCPSCGTGGHLARDCTKFKNLCLDDRWKVVKEKRLCRRCLVQHPRWPCKGEACGVNGCQMRHHRLLHYDHPPVLKPNETTTNAPINIHRQQAASTLFRMLPVTLYGKKGQVDTYAFLDDGSSVTLVERTLADKLGLEGRKESLCIHWTSGIKKNFDNTQLVDLEISGVNDSKRFKASTVYTVDDLGLPEQSMDYDVLSTKFKYLHNLPVKNMQSAAPGILIGLSNIHLMATLKLREGREGEPIATKTRLGWAVYGSMPEGESSFLHRQMHICDSSPEVDLHEYVRGFFAVESLGVVAVQNEQSVDEQRANKILVETTRRTDSGRFETGLLWKHDYIEFPDSRPMAERRLKCLEKRLTRNPELYDQVRKQIAEFQQKGFAHKATVQELQCFDPRRTWYLPLGLVINPKKPGKVRLIWDAAAKVDGVSLNAMLLKGPDLLTPLLSVLFQFRERQVAICADIEAMFHQVLIRVRLYVCVVFF